MFLRLSVKQPVSCHKENYIKGYQERHVNQTLLCLPWLWEEQKSVDSYPFQKCQWKINSLARHEQTTIFRLRTGHCGLRAHLKRIGIMDSAIAIRRNRRSTTSPSTVPSGGNRDISYGRRMSQPPTSCSERQKTCTCTAQFLATCGLRVWARMIDCRRRISFPCG